DLWPTLYAIDDKAYSTNPRTIASAAPSDLNDWIDFDVSVDSARGSITLVFRMRNSLLSTTLLYDVMLGPAGARALDWLNQDLTKISTAVELGRWHQRRAGLHISVWRNGAYEEVARIPDSGPISWHEVAATIPVCAGERSVRIRLSFLADHWRIDYVGIAGSARPIQPRIVPVTGIETTPAHNEDQARSAVSTPDDQYLQTNPGDRFFVTFETGT